MEEIQCASNNKDNIIKILQNQLNTLHRNHKETIDEIESIKCKYNNSVHELENVKKILEQCESELKKIEEERKDQSSDKHSDSNAVADPKLQGIAVKVANVQGKANAVRQIVSDSAMPEDIQDDIDNVDNEFKDRLRIQYDRIEDILNEHSWKLDNIKAQICGDNGRRSFNTNSKIRFSLPHINTLSESTFGSNINRSHLHLEKVNLIATLRQTNNLLTQEIDDLREQKDYYKRAIHWGVQEFIEDVIETAKLSIEPAETPEMNLERHSEMKALHDMNNFLRNQNQHFQNEVLEHKAVNDEVTAKFQELSMKHEELKDKIDSTVELDSAQKSVDDLNGELQLLKQELRTREDMIDSLEAHNERLNTLIGQLTNEQENQSQQFDNSLRASCDRFDILKQEIDKMSMQKQDTDSKLQKAVREKASIARNMNVMSNTMQQYKNELEVKQTECVKYKEHVQRLEEQIRNFDLEMMEKDAQHERQMTKNKSIISDIEGKYRSSREEMEELNKTARKLVELKGQNEKLVGEIEQLSMELEKFKAFKGKDPNEMDKQMQKLQCFCKKLEEKLESTKAEISYEDAKKEVEIKQHVREKAIMETQLALLREEIVMHEEQSKALMTDIDKYKEIVGDLTMNAQELKKGCRSPDLKQENECLMEEVREKNCEIDNLRLTLEEYNSNRSYAPDASTKVKSCQNVNTSARFIPPCQQTDYAMKELRKLTDDMKNTQSKISSIVNSNQEFAYLLQSEKSNKCCPAVEQPKERMSMCQQSIYCYGKLSGLKGKVENLNQKEQELQYLLNELERQNNKLVEFNNKRQRNDVEIEDRLATIKHKKEAVDAMIKDYQHTQNEISKKYKRPGNTCYSLEDPSNIGAQQQKKPVALQDSIAKSQTTTPSSFSNDPILNNYQSKLEKAVTKYKSPDEKQSSIISPSYENPSQQLSTIIDEDGGDIVVPLAPSRIDSIEATIMMREKRKFSRNTSKKAKVIMADVRENENSSQLSNANQDQRRVSMKTYDDKVVSAEDSNSLLGTSLEISERDSSVPNANIRPIFQIYSSDLKIKKFQPKLHFSTLYSKVPNLLYTQRFEKKLAVHAEFNLGLPVISGGPLGANTYRLWQIHFHWGDDDSSGSEHVVNDTSFVMEMHAIHIKDTHANIEDAMKDTDGGLATICYLYTYSDDDDAAMSSIVETLLRFDMRPDDDVLEFQSYFSLDLLIQPFDSGYVTYRGSRAICHTDKSGPVSNLIWIVAPFTNVLSRGQMDGFRELKSQKVSRYEKVKRNVHQQKMVVFAALSSGEEKMNSGLASKNLFLPINVP